MQPPGVGKQHYATGMLHSPPVDHFVWPATYLLRALVAGLASVAPEHGWAGMQVSPSPPSCVAALNSAFHCHLYCYLFPLNRVTHF